MEININNISPEYWGRSGWIFLNSIALTYKKENKEHYKKFIEQLPYILPCEKCGNHLLKNIKDIDDVLETKEKFKNVVKSYEDSIYKDIRSYKNVIDFLKYYKNSVENLAKELQDNV